MKDIASSFPVVVLVEPRQVGKNSVLERTFQACSYICLDVAAHAEMAETRPEVRCYIACTAGQTFGVSDTVEARSGWTVWELEV